MYRPRRQANWCVNLRKRRPRQRPPLRRGASSMRTNFLVRVGTHTNARQAARAAAPPWGTWIPCARGDRLRAPVSEIHCSQYFRVVLEHGGRIVRLTRLSTAYPSVQAFIDESDAICKKLDLIGRSGRGLLTDLRKGPGRNDKVFEDALKTTVPNFQRNYRRVALLVETAAGALHVKRHPAMQKDNVLVVADEAVAIEWLLGGRA